MPASDPGIRVLTTPPSGGAEVLEPAALQFLGALARRFEPERQRRLARRRERQQELDAGRLPDFLPETKEIRDRDWTVAPIRPDLTDRRVEITGPVERKMMINALNSGANVFMADFEDANAPTWENNLTGQQNVRDAVTRTIAYTSPEGKRYALEARTATLVVRPRGWHLVEKHLTVDGQPISASLFDFGLTFSIPRRSSPQAARAPTSICRSSRAISRRACGTTSSSSRRMRSGFRVARSARRS